MFSLKTYYVSGQKILCFALKHTMFRGKTYHVFKGNIQWVDLKEHKCPKKVSVDSRKYFRCCPGRIVRFASFL